MSFNAATVAGDVYCALLGEIETFDESQLESDPYSNTIVLNTYGKKYLIEITELETD